MTDKESLAKLEKILKQLEKISNNTGISAGVKNEKGETKKRFKLTTEEITRQTKIAKIYKKILGTGYNEADANKTAERFRIKMGISTTYYAKTESFLESIKNNIELLSTNLNFSNVERLLSDIKTNLTSTGAVSSSSINLLGIESILNDSKTYLFELISKFSDVKVILKDIETKIGSLNFSSLENILKNIETKLTSLIGGLNPTIFDDIKNTLIQIESNTRNSSVGGGLSVNKRDLIQIFTNSFDRFRRDLKWNEFSKKITDYISSSKASAGKIFDTLSNVGGLALLGTGLLLVVTALAKTGFVDVGQSLKVILLITTFVGLILYLGKNFGKMKGVGKNFAILSGTIVATTLALAGLGKLPFKLILLGIIKVSLVYKVLSYVLKDILEVSSFIDKKDLREVMISLGMFAGVVIASTLLLAVIGLLPFKLIILGLIKTSFVAGAMYGVLYAFKKLKPKDLQATMKSLAMFVGISAATLLLTIAFSKIPFMTLLEGLAKMLTVSAALLGVLKVMEYIKPRNVLKSMLGLAIFSVILLGFMYLVDKLKSVDVGGSIKAILGIGLALTAFSFLVRIIGQIVQRGLPQILLGAGVMLGLSFILGYLADNLSLFANKPWGGIYKGLGLATLAIILFGVVVAGIGALMLSGVGAAVLAAGAVAVVGLSFVLSILANAMSKFANKPWDDIKNGIKSSIEAVSSFGLFLAKFGALSVFLAPLMAIGSVALLGISQVMGSFAESLSKYQNIDAENLKKIGDGMQSLGFGLMAMLGGSAAGIGTGIINGLSSFFGLDPVGQIKKFEKVDVEKIYKLGEGVKMLGDGLKTLSSTDINLSKVTDGVIKLTKPLAEFSGSLEKFSDAYTKFEKIKMQADTEFNIQADTGVKEAIKEATDRQLDVQIEQLSELRRNNQLMEILINRSGGSGGIIGSFGGEEQGGNITSPSFRTKNDYLANMKMMTMTISNA